MRKIGLDIGDVRIGVAVSDMLNILANPYETYVRKSIDEDIEHFQNLLKEQNADTFVVGLPLNMDGTAGDRVKKTKEYASRLAEKIDAKFVYQDERLTTVQAEKVLISGGVRRDKRKKVVDKVASTIILQAYLDRFSK
ncbi:MAG: Holliday junction resolvase RuvX [Clostridia bacterium]|nr:Holliday junction resolvase RuvX [Clostridia bacterium]MDY5264730.1 Holliday junction resolvase RuvX [Eubacteriales bacterium]